MSMIAKRRRRRTGGFTLIELLVVVSIIALLISILLPSLSRAREQAKLTVCQSNISSVGKTFILYLLDLNKIPLFQTSNNSWCSWSFGGWSGTNRDHWEGIAGGVFNIETADRPLSVYALKGGTIARAVDTVPDDWAGGPETWPTEETPSYKCPSDQLSAQWQWGNPDSTQVSAYNDVGSSYQLNFHWWGQATEDEACEPTDLPCQVNLGVLLYLGQMNRNPARFVSLMEDPMDWGLAAGWPGGPGIQTMGFHGRFSKHVTFFLDGHAGIDLIDTRHQHDSKPNPPGPRHGGLSVVGNWTCIDETKAHEDSSRHSS
ncbi:MAG: prepilin-type N-terminal cleavage/methylation domain-containing protein [Planctomycetes bacterium]|nr:prepilin-type N-terminal cleavage/methylation domain-containing protein [Planctomycetota bacterium]